MINLSEELKCQIRNHSSRYLEAITVNTASIPTFCYGIELKEKIKIVTECVLVLNERNERNDGINIAELLARILKVSKGKVVISI